jgi:REP element-mobilizing transposase RayT
MQEHLVQIHRRRLPHWRVEGGTYAVTFRLGDSLPADVVAKLAAEAETARTDEERRRLRSRAEKYLDAGYGQCLLRRPDCAAIVRDAMFHSNGDRYDLGPWSVMPNHVHSIVKPREDFDLDQIVADWRKISARRINELLKQRGSLWYPEPYDSWLRDVHEYRRAEAYILRNPEKAGLREWPFVGTADERIFFDQ